MSENTLDRKDLKILAYKEKVAQLEEDNADLRVEVTILSKELQAAREQVADYNRDVEAKADAALEED